MELEMDYLTSARLSEKIYSKKCQFFAPKYEHFPRLVAQVHIMAGQNKCKEKVPNVSDPNQNVETTCNSKLKFT